jgi:sugar phosphate isomerase/epimerase
MRTEYGIQMFSIRDLAQKDLEAALRTVSEQGYKYIEFAGFHGNSAEDVAAWLKKYGLVVSGTHTGWEELTPDRIMGTILYHKIIGNKNIIIPWADLSDRLKLGQFVALVNQAQPLLAQHGITLSYHNHKDEFLPNKFGQIPHEVLERCTNIKFEIDTFWAYAAGKDPIALLERLGDRVSVIHLKDGLAGGQGKALGEGTAPVAAVREYAIAHGLEMVVESETLNPTGIKEVERCIKYLRSLEA